MKKLLQQRTTPHQVFPSPAAGEMIWETPPCFVWLQEEGYAEYTVTVKGKDFFWEGHTERNYIVPDVVFPAGEYEWNLSSGEAERGWVAFSIAENAVEFIRPDSQAIYDSIPVDLHPFHLFCKEDIPGLVKDHTADIEVLKRNIALAYEDGIPEAPRFNTDPEALPYREYFGRHRDFVDRNMVACALGWQLMGDEKAAAHAKALFLEVCSWDPAAECALHGGKYGDELGLSNARCLPSVYDLIYDLLSEEEKKLAQNAIAAYALQCEKRLSATDFMANPGNSHVGRLPAYLGNAAMVLKGTGFPEDMLLCWLDTAVEIYGGIFPFYGGPDGGWAEGPFYASSYTKWYLPFFNAVDRFMGTSYLDRPFYQRLPHYLIHFNDPAAEIKPFGDGYWCHSENKEWPGFLAQDPFRIYAEKFGPAEAVEMEKSIPQPDVFLLHLLDIFLPVRKDNKRRITGEASCLQTFPYAGLVSMRNHIAGGEDTMAVMARASRYGAFSHSHADQGSFVLFYEGTALISPSGYFGRSYGTIHHFQWTNTTAAHNCILVDGEGQLTRSHLTIGSVGACHQNGSIYTAELDLDDAHPALRNWKRKLTMDADERTLMVEDFVEADNEVTLDWLLHSLSRPEADGNGAFLTRNGICLDICPLEGIDTAAEIIDYFPVDLNEGEPEQYHVTMPEQFHMTWKTEKKKSHHIIVKMKISK
ncbi:MAG: heparinase II/III family protein [Oscillospiraceae bacterium]|nr:heparinase II/III family protein [Oscillospiraceae bacterium]